MYTCPCSLDLSEPLIIAEDQEGDKIPEAECEAAQDVYECFKRVENWFHCSKTLHPAGESWKRKGDFRMEDFGEGCWSE